MRVANSLLNREKFPVLREFPNLASTAARRIGPDLSRARTHLNAAQQEQA
jgi:hypothetical protein